MMNHDQIPETATQVIAQLVTILTRRQALVRRLQAFTPADIAAEPTLVQGALQAYLRRLTSRQAALLTRLGDLLPPQQSPPVQPTILAVA